MLLVKSRHPLLVVISFLSLFFFSFCVVIFLRMLVPRVERVEELGFLKDQFLILFRSPLDGWTKYLSPNVDQIVYINSLKSCLINRRMMSVVWRLLLKNPGRNARTEHKTLL